MSSFIFFKMTSQQLEYGPLTKTITSEHHTQKEVESFEYCYNENTSSTEFSMTNEITVSGVVKAFNIGGSSSHSFVKASSDTISTGESIKTTSIEHITKRVKSLHELKSGDEFLCTYAPIIAMCFTINGGKRQYALVPKSHVIVRVVDKQVLDRLANGTYLMDSISWGSVASEYPDLKLDDLRAEMRGLEPKNINIDVEYGTYKIKTTSHSASGCPEGWGLSAWRNPSDGVRSIGSTWVAVHSGDDWPCLWEIKPGRDDDTYQIVTKPHTRSQHPGGWGLSAFPLHGGQRSADSTRIAVHEGSTWPMDWKIVKDQSKGTYRILTTHHFDGGQVANWGLSAWGDKVRDTLRSHESSWVHVHEGNYWPMNWVLEKQD